MARQDFSQILTVSTHSRVEAAAIKPFLSIYDKVFQHTAAWRRLLALPLRETPL